MDLDVHKIRQDFPNLSVSVRGKKLVYLDNAATTFKPRSVIEATSRHYTTGVANIHRGVHYLSEMATEEYEQARLNVRNFINASDVSEVIFTRGTTESINLVAQTHGRAFLKPGDEVLISAMEHHSNIVPWQMLCEQNGCVLKVVPINEHGEIIFEEYTKLLSPRTKIVSIVYISNSLGTINPVAQMIPLAHKVGAVVLIDGAQAISHGPVDVQKLDCDFFAFSGHKLFGPTGVGVLYGKRSLMERMPPYQGGGDMIANVTFEKTTYNVLPYKFEAGTPNIAGAIGLGAAIDYVKSIGFDAIGSYKKELLDYGTQALLSVKDLRLIGTARNKSSVLSFVLPDIHPHDLGTIVDAEGVAIRTGHHCTQPVMKYFNIPATARASLAFYNTQDELDALVHAVHKAREIFK